MLETSVALYVQYPANPSVANSNMVVSATVLPGANGILYIKFQGTNTVNGGIGTNQVGGYLNRSVRFHPGPSNGMRRRSATDLKNQDRSHRSWQHEYGWFLHNES